MKTRKEMNWQQNRRMVAYAAADSHYLVAVRLTIFKALLDNERVKTHVRLEADGCTDSRSRRRSSS